MKKSCRNCEFLVYYGGFEYDCARKDEECPINRCDIRRPSIASLKVDKRNPSERYSIPKFIKD